MIITKKVLLVEDDSDDQFLFLEAINQVDNSIECVIAYNGKEALDYLRDNPTLPRAIFLDLNMPVMGGLECLELLRQNESDRDIPVIVLTTSDNHVYMATVKELGAKAYLVKHPDYKGLFNTLSTIVEAGFHVSKFPA